jgi:17beta-estradiol 17-dehydrogenase / very-long-chain 3-oxoacyl-CoA reductase
MDFAQDKDTDYAKLKELVSSLDVAILANNVGQSHSMPVPFIETPEDEMKNIITINCMGTLKVTQIVAPGMAQRKRGLILTMGSMGGTLPTPLLATYSGSKAFLQQWSTALGAELAPFGVDVEIVLASLITGAMSKVRRPSLIVPTPRRFVRDTLGKVGLSCGAQGIAYTSTPFWGHALLQWWIENTVGLMSHTTLWFNKRMHADIRTRALKKKERDTKKSS